MSQQKVSTYKKNTWATILNINEDIALKNFKEWCFVNKFIEANTKYALVRMLLSIGSKIFYNEHLNKFTRDLYTKGYIKQGDLEETINIMLLYALEHMPKEL
ncbi:MAG: hypothetical protein GY870_12405 [archaeon]|nr:hypothetical protein [archaeon]